MSIPRWFLVAAALSFAAAADAAIPEVDVLPDAPVAVDTHAAWQAHLVAQRAVHLERLRAYAAAGVFPTPQAVEGFQHQFLDVNGNPCAVASLIWQSGHEDLVRATAATQNDVVLSEVVDGPLVEWMLASGLTREEVAVIQEPGWVGSFQDLNSMVAQQAERERIQSHLTAVIELLETDTDKSIAKALRRLGDRGEHLPPPTR